MKEGQYPPFFRFKEMNNKGYAEIDEKDTGQEPANTIKGKLCRIIPAFQKCHIQEYVPNKPLNSVRVLESVALHMIENNKERKHMKYIEFLQLRPHILERRLQVIGKVRIFIVIGHQESGQHEKDFNAPGAKIKVLRLPQQPSGMIQKNKKKPQKPESL